MNRHPRRLTGTERRELMEALLSAFRVRLSLNLLIQEQFNPIPESEVGLGHLDQFTDGPLDNRIDQIITKFEELDRIDALVDRAHVQNSDNGDLRRFHQKYFKSIQRQVSSQVLERLVIPTSKYIDPASWREVLELAERRVCRIEASGGIGSGFLVAPDVVMTNQHVVADVIRNPQRAVGVVVRFDYKRLPDGTEAFGKSVELAADWLLASSPPSPADLSTGPRDREATETELDFALLRLASWVGAELVDGRERGWFQLPAQPAALANDTPVFILQHPLGGPLKLAMEMRSVIEMTPGRTRVRYRTNTESGSSGSPCFDQSWNLVALHHSGDPEFRRSAEYNEGIPIDTIANAVPNVHRAELKLV